MQNRIKVLTSDLEYCLSDIFPADAQIKELKTKIEAIKIDVDQSLETVRFWENLRMKKLILLN